MEEAGRERKMGGSVDLYWLAQGGDCLVPLMLGAFNVNYSTRGAVDASGEGNLGVKSRIYFELITRFCLDFRHFY